MVRITSNPHNQMESRRRQLAALMVLGLSGAFAPQNKEFYETRETRKVSPNGSTYKSIKQGQQQFTYDDGFTCEALNQKSADKKHNKWLAKALALPIEGKEVEGE